MIKTYNELTKYERKKTFIAFQELCDLHPEIVPYDDFVEYDKEQSLLDMNFDAETLECLG